jgi:hypothetical protein
MENMHDEVDKAKQLQESALVANDALSGLYLASQSIECNN